MTTIRVRCIQHCIHVMHTNLGTRFSVIIFNVLYRTQCNHVSTFKYLKLTQFSFGKKEVIVLNIFTLDIGNFTKIQNTIGVYENINFYRVDNKNVQYYC